MTVPPKISEAFAADRPAIGARCVTGSPPLIQAFADLGFDYAWLDLEHAGGSPLDADALGTVVWPAQAAGIDLLVRLPSGEPNVVRKVLDAGIRTVLIPRVETAVEVRRAVRAARFTYDGDPGDRGVASSQASRWGADLDEAFAGREDRETTVGVMIENRSAVDNLDEILAVPDLGFVFIGPADLSVAIGRPLAVDHPDVTELVEEIRETCTAAGVPVGRIVNDADGAITAIADGYRLLRIGGDIGAVRSVLGKRLETVRDRSVGD